jgi:hypothetical protein
MGRCCGTQPGGTISFSIPAVNGRDTMQAYDEGTGLYSNILNVS